MSGFMKPHLNMAQLLTLCGNLPTLNIPPLFFLCFLFLSWRNIICEYQSSPGYTAFTHKLGPQDLILKEGFRSSVQHTGCTDEETEA